MSHIIVWAGKSEIYMGGQQAGNSGRIWHCSIEYKISTGGQKTGNSDFLCSSLKVEFILEKPDFVHKAFNWLDVANPHYGRWSALLRANWL